MSEMVSEKMNEKVNEKMNEKMSEKTNEKVHGKIQVSEYVCIPCRHVFSVIEECDKEVKSPPFIPCPICNDHAVRMNQEEQNELNTCITSFAAMSMLVDERIAEAKQRNMDYPVCGGRL